MEREGKDECVSQTSTCRSHSRNQFSHGGTLTYICCPNDSPALSIALCFDPKFVMFPPQKHTANTQNNTTEKTNIVVDHQVR